MRFSKALKLCCLLTGGLSFGQVWAQNASTETPEASGSTELETITVSAQRFTENLQKVPLAISAVSGDSLRALNVFNAADLNQVVPNLTIGVDGLGSQIGMRGIFSNNAFESGDPAVAFNVDGVYLARQRSAIVSMYDIDHVEVLRGPQGTLYGRNAVAGAINVITAKPDLNQFAASGSLQYGNYNAVQTFGMLNIPILDTLGIRVAYQTDRHDGYSHNEPSRNYNDLDAVSARVEALWKPVDHFSALLALDYFHNSGIAGGYTGGASIGIYSQSTGSTPYNYAVPVISGEPFGDERAEGATLTLNYELPLFNFTYVGNYRKDRQETAGTLPVQGPIVTTFAGGVCADVSDPTCTYVNNSSHEYQESHEFRVSQQTDLYRWVAGIFYFKEHNTIFTGIHPCPCGPFDLTFITPDAAEQSRAAFGQGVFNVTQALHLTAGIRYTSDFKGRISGLYGVPSGGIIGFGCPLCLSGGELFSSPNYASLRFTKTTWRAGVDYDLTSDTMLFGSVSTGYKEGGYNDGEPPNLIIYAPETVKNFEIGAKSQLFDHRLQINVDGFRTLYTDYQAQGGALVNGVVTGLILNAGKATIDGVELETVGLLTPLDRLGFNATYLHARFTSFVLPNGDGFNGYTYEDLSGNRLPNAPRSTLRLDYQHTFPLANGASVVPRVDSSYVTGQFLEYHNFPVGYQGAYHRSGASVTYNAPKTWSATFFVRNIENKAVLSTMQADNGVPPQYIGLAGKGAFYFAPRTFGLRVNANF